MANIQSHQGGMYAHTTFPPTRGDTETQHQNRWVAIGLALLAVLVAVFAGLAYARFQGTTTTEVATTAAQSADLTAYAPGGSVYAAQVPSVVAVDLAAYAPGGSVYEAQVP